MENTGEDLFKEIEYQLLIQPNGKDIPAAKIQEIFGHHGIFDNLKESFKEMISDLAYAEQEAESAEKEAREFEDSAETLEREAVEYIDDLERIVDSLEEELQPEDDNLVDVAYIRRLALSLRHLADYTVDSDGFNVPKKKAA